MTVSSAKCDGGIVMFPSHFPGSMVKGQMEQQQRIFGGKMYSNGRVFSPTECHRNGGNFEGEKILSEISKKIFEEKKCWCQAGNLLKKNLKMHDFPLFFEG